MQPLAFVCILHLISRFVCNYVFCRWGVNVGYMAHQLQAATWNGRLENLETNNIQLGTHPWAAVLSTTGIDSDVHYSVRSSCQPVFKTYLNWWQNLTIVISPLSLVTYLERLLVPAKVGGGGSHSNKDSLTRKYTLLFSSRLKVESFYVNITSKGQPDFYNPTHTHTHTFSTASNEQHWTICSISIQSKHCFLCTNSSSLSLHLAKRKKNKLV